MAELELFGKRKMVEAVATMEADTAVHSRDIFSDRNLADSRALFRKLRDLGDAVWIADLELYVVARYKDVVAALRAPDKLVSSQGVSVNPDQNAASGTMSSTILSDGDTHRRLQRAVMKPLTPSALAQLQDRVARLANGRVVMLATGQPFDAVRELAAYLPLAIVAEMVGIRGVDNEKILGWSNAIFDAFGPPEHARAGTSHSILEEFFGFMQSISRENLVPGGWASQLFEAADRGEITHQEAHGLIGDYLVPSLDTTIYATAQMLFSLAAVPGAWEKVHANPQLVPGVVDEAVRIATPLRGFTRVAVEDFPLEDTVIPAGSRVWLLYGSANLDERKYPDPDLFDVERNPRDHLGWGHGVHLCMGKHLARLEMEAVLKALLNNVSNLETVASNRLVNNSAQGFSELVMRMQAI